MRSPSTQTSDLCGLPGPVGRNAHGRGGRGRGNILMSMENDELWRGLLTGEGSPLKHDRARYKRYPGRPRCKTCLVPLAGPFAPMVRLMTKRGPSRKNPNYCSLCEEFVRTHPGGAEIKISLLFADVRGSTTLAENMSAAAFTSLMNRFFASSNRILIDSDALVDKLVGDEVIGLYIPAITKDHSRRPSKQQEISSSPPGTRMREGPGCLWGPASIRESRMLARSDRIARSWTSPRWGTR
jgi:hypothetical protein